MSNCLLKEAQDMKNQLTTWRRSLHQMPELGTALPKTVAFVTEQLKKWRFLLRYLKTFPASWQPSEKENTALC